MPDARSLSIQSVLYESSVASAARVADCIATAAMAAVAAKRLSTWELAFGDSSPAPVLDAAAIARITQFCTAAGGTFRYRFFGENLGHGGGHNALSTGGTSDLMLFLNPDALLGPTALAELIGGLGDGVGVVDARQVPLEHPKEYVAATGETSWCAGACMMTTRAIFDAVGGFDSETFFMYCDDVDFSWRVRLAGHRALYVPAARVFHDKRFSPAGAYTPTDAEVYYSAEAALLLAHKYSRPGLARHLAGKLRRHGTDPSLRAVAEYRSRRRSGTLPAAIDPDHRVAEFVGQTYGPVRF